MFGLEVTSTFVSERENVDEDICAMGTGPFKVEVDLMQPLDPEKKPAVHATPLNHVGLWIDDLPKAVEWLSANGVRFAPGGIRKGAPVSTSPSCTPRATRSSRSAAKAC
jgi:lactoylglutathione lyase